MAGPEGVVLDAEIEKIDLVGFGANEEGFAIRKSISDVSDGATIGDLLEKRTDESVTPQELAEFVASHVPGASTPDIMDAMDELADDDIENISQRELASLTADAYDASTGEILDILSRFTKEGGQSVDTEEFLETIKESEDADVQDVALDVLKEAFEDDEDLAEVLKDEFDIESEEDVDEDVEKEESEEDDVDFEDLPETVQKRLEKADKVDELEEQLEKERERRRTEELRKEVDEKYNMVKGSTDQKAQLIKEAEDKLSEESEEFVKEIMTSYEEQAKGSRAFKEVGTTGGSTPGSAEQKLEKKAEEIADEEDISFHKAMDKAIRKHSDLYEKSRKEQTG